MVVCNLHRRRRLAKVAKESILSVNCARYCIVNSRLKVGDTVVYRQKRQLKKGVIIADAVTKMKCSGADRAGSPQPGVKRQNSQLQTPSAKFCKIDQSTQDQATVLGEFTLTK